MIFDSRMHAGMLLAEKLAAQGAKVQAVIGLARGGVMVALPIKETLHIPLGILVVKKISSPDDPELAIGALAPDGVIYVDWKLAIRLGTDEAYINRQTAELSKTIKVKDRFYQKFHPHVNLENKAVILTDDGAATGATIKAAVRWLRAKDVATILLALPVAARDVLQSIRSAVDDAIVLQQPANPESVGQYYKDFIQVEESEIAAVLDKKGRTV